MPEVFGSAIDDLPIGLKRWYQLADLDPSEQCRQAQLDHAIFNIICPQDHDDFSKPLTKKRIALEVEKELAIDITEWPEAKDSINFVVDELARLGYLTNKVRGQRTSPVGRNATFLFKMRNGQFYELAILRRDFASNFEYFQNAPRPNKSSI